jgi:hypothetical protein
MEDNDSCQPLLVKERLHNNVVFIWFHILRNIQQNNVVSIWSHILGNVQQISL